MLKDDIIILLEDSARELGYMIYDYSLDLRGAASRINVKIDSLTGIKHSDCASYSNMLSRKLDETALLPDYSLEISSPGLQRKLRVIEDFMRFVDAPVKIVVDDVNKRETIKGFLKGVNNNMVLLLAEKENIEIPFANIIRANLDY